MSTRNIQFNYLFKIHHSEYISEMDIGEKVKELRKLKGLKQDQLAVRIKKAQNYVSRFEGGEFKNPTKETLELFAKGLDISFQELIEFGSKNSDDKIANKIKGRPAPVLGKAACGRWEDFTDLEYPVGHADEWMVTVSKDPNAFYVKAKGDSMIGGNINDGDLLLVEPNKEVFNGCKVLAKDPDQGVTVKLFYKEKDKVRLQPMNPEYPPLFIKANNEDFRVYRITQKVSDL